MRNFINEIRKDFGTMPIVVTLVFMFIDSILLSLGGTIIGITLGLVTPVLTCLLLCVLDREEFKNFQNKKKMLILANIVMVIALGVVLAFSKGAIVVVGIGLLVTGVSLYKMAKL